jgi:ABC-type bacteriocin/lantibiotic exporter with double-glycine peptidase domain
MTIFRLYARVLGPLGSQMHLGMVLALANVALAFVSMTATSATQLVSLRRNIGVIFQKPLLLNRSIAKNLRVGNPDATDEEILTACKRAEGA